MDLVQRVFVCFLIMLLSNGEAVEQKVLKRSKRNHVNCRPKSLVMYRLTVHTLWSKETFPKMFPTYRPHAQWSSLVGRTHGSDYQMWELGANSSLGVKHFAEQGDPSQLNIESYQGYDDILDGFVAPPVNTSVGQTSAVIILDGHHSKLSFMMKIIPSPDWFVGVSSLDLCAHGRWRNKLHVDLGPFDAGTDQGLTFTAPNWPNTPAELITAITSSVPDHPAGSFFYPDYEELPRLAFLDLDMVSEFRHKETFMNVPQHYVTTVVNNDEAINNRKSKDSYLPEPTVRAGSKQLKQPFNILRKKYESVTSNANDEPIVNEGISAKMNSKSISETPWGNDKGVQESEVKDSIYKAEDSDDGKVYIHDKHETTYGPITHSGNPINSIALHTVSETDIEEISPQSVQDGSNLSRSTRKSTNSTGYNNVNESDSTPENIEISLNNGSDRTLRTSPIFSIDSLFREPDRSHHKSNGSASAPQTKSHTANKHVSLGIDCEVGEWSGWSICSQTCGFGQQERSRNISVYPENGGTTCPQLRQTNWCGSMRSCSWNHFSFLEHTDSKRQLREGLNRRRLTQKRELTKKMN